VADDTDVASAELAAALSRAVEPTPDARHRASRPPIEADRARDREPEPAEEMDDVASQNEKAAKADDPKAAGDATAEPSARSGAAKQAEPAAAAKGGGSATTTTTKPDAEADTKAGSKHAGKPGPDKADKGGPGKGKAAMSAVGSGVARVRNLVASIVWLAAVICAAVLALGALFTALDQANESNEIVSWVLDRGRDLVGPFSDVFRLETAKNTLLVNWGIAALAYLIAGKVIERVIRP